MDTSKMRYPFGRCWKCGHEFNSELRQEYNITHCPYCGTEIDDCFSSINSTHEEERKGDIFCEDCGLCIYKGGNWITRDKNPKQPGVCSGPCGRELCAHCGDWDEEGECPKCRSERPEYKADVKTGWWKASFDMNLNGEDVRFEDLSETSQEHILNCIRDGCSHGQLVEDIEDQEENSFKGREDERNCFCSNCEATFMEGEIKIKDGVEHCPSCGKSGCIGDGIQF